MANDVTKNPLVIDTAGAGDVLGASAPVSIQSIDWDPGAAGADGNRAVVTDTAGREICSWTIRTGYLGPYSVSWPYGLDVKGIKVPTLAVGKLHIALVL